MKHSSAGGVGPLAEYAMAEQLRRRSFDAAVIFTVFSQNPLPAAFLFTSPRFRCAWRTAAKTRINC